ncbi:MAG TPA: secretion protein HlyD, partial [Chloroflexi bacterium]|nr:secretion protein HlyD [Chloroflexota bacterium]
MTIRKLLIGLVVVALLSAGGYWGYLNYLAPQAGTATATPGASSGPVTASDTVSAEGVVVPIRQARIGFTLPGRLEAWLVNEGEAVSAGQVLASMAAPSIAQSVAQAEAALAVAEAQLAQAQAGAREQELAAADASVRAAEQQ